MSVQQGFVQAAGRNLEYRLIPAHQVNRPTLVFLHEGLGSVAMWRDFPAKVAAATGCRTLVYSRYGYGESDLLTEPFGVRYMHDEALVALPELLDALRADTYHLVILDLMMPALSGMDLLEQIRKADDDIAIVICTGYPSVDTARTRTIRAFLDSAATQRLLSPAGKHVRNRSVHYEIPNPTIRPDFAQPMLGLVEAVNPGTTFVEFNTDVQGVSDQLSQLLSDWRHGSRST